jgi:hypothetical protein
MAKAGLGVYFVFQDQGYTSDVLITASSPAVSAPIQAEAQALLLAGNIIASSLSLRDSVLFTDCSNLAKAAAAPEVLRTRQCFGRLEGKRLSFRTQQQHRRQKSFTFPGKSMASLTNVLIRPIFSLVLGLSVPAETRLIGTSFVQYLWRSIDCVCWTL